MQVKLLAHTPNPDALVAAAARVCYSPLGGDEIMENFKEGEAESLVKKLMSMGHQSPLEHIAFTFAIDGVSRALSHQLVRHRIGVSYSQKSQRYVKEKGANAQFVIPPTIAERPELKAKFEQACADIMDVYDALAAEVPAEDARYILPNANVTNLVVTMNARSLLHFFELRCCQRAQWEIRDLAEKMLSLVRDVAPVLFKKAGPTCRTLGICFEDQYSCGRCKDVRSRA